MTAEGVHRLPSHISKTVLSIVKTGPPKADTGVMLVLGSRRHTPEQIINKLRDADFLSVRETFVPAFNILLEATEHRAHFS